MSQVSLFTPASELKHEYLVKEDLKHAFALQAKALEIQAEIDKSRHELEQELSPLKEEIRQLLETRDRIVTEHLQDDVKQEGPFFLKETAKPSMKLDAELFATNYPDEFDQLWRDIGSAKFKPSKTDAANVLTSYQIDKCSKPQGEYRYEVEYNPTYGVEP